MRRTAEDKKATELRENELRKKRAEKGGYPAVATKRFWSPLIVTTVRRRLEQDWRIPRS